MFDLVPPAFATLAEHIYDTQGRPSVSRNTIWGVYAQMLVSVRAVYATDPTDALAAAAHPTLADEGDDAGPPMALTAGLRELRNGDQVVGTDGYYYMGGAPENPLEPEGPVSAGPAAAGGQADTDGVAMVCAVFSDDESVGDELEW